MGTLDKLRVQAINQSRASVAQQVLEGEMKVFDRKMITASVIFVGLFIAYMIVTREGCDRASKSGPMNYEKPSAFVSSADNVCKALGVQDMVTVIVDDDPSDVPSGMLLGLVGDAEWYALDPTNEDLGVWAQAMTPRDPHLLVTPFPVTSGLDLAFIPGYATRDNKDLATWNYSCNEFGCSGKYTVCSGLKFVGSYHHGISIGNCQNQLSSLGVQEISCHL